MFIELSSLAIIMTVQICNTYFESFTNHNGELNNYLVIHAVHSYLLFDVLCHKLLAPGVARKGKDHRHGNQRQGGKNIEV